MPHRIGWGGGIAIFLSYLFLINYEDLLEAINTKGDCYGKSC